MLAFYADAVLLWYFYWFVVPFFILNHKKKGESIMKVKLEELKNAISNTNTVGGSVNTAMSLEAGSNELVLSAVNNKFAVFSSVDIEDVNKKETLCVEVNANLLKSSVSYFSGDYVLIEKLQGIICIKDESESSLIRLPYAEMSAANRISGEDEQYDTIAVKHLSSYINRTCHAFAPVSANGGDMKKSSFYFETDGKNIRVTATDGYRISSRAGAVGKIKKSFIVPGAEMKAIVPIIGDDEVEMELTDKVLRIRNKKAVIILPLIDGIFFDTEKIISQLEDMILLRMTVSRRDFLEACELSSLVDKVACIKINEGKVQVSSAGALGDIKRTLPVQTDADTEVKVFFAIKYMMDALKSITSPDVTICFEKNKNIMEIIPSSSKSCSGKSIEVVFPVCRK